MAAWTGQAYPKGFQRFEMRGKKLRSVFTAGSSVKELFIVKEKYFEDDIAPKYRVENFELEKLPSDDLATRIRMAVNALEDLTFDGEHHKDYAIDQCVRILLSDKYSLWAEARLDWEKGIAP